MLERVFARTETMSFTAPVVGQEDVRRVGVAVNQVEPHAVVVGDAVRVVERVGDARADPGGEVVRYSGAAPDALVAGVGHGAPQDELHRDERAPLVDARLDRLDDVRMREAREDLRLVAEHVDVLRVEERSSRLPSGRRGTVRPRRLARGPRRSSPYRRRRGVRARRICCWVGDGVGVYRRIEHNSGGYTRRSMRVIASLNDARFEWLTTPISREPRVERLARVVLEPVRRPWPYPPPWVRTPFSIPTSNPCGTASRQFLRVLAEDLGHAILAAVREASLSDESLPKLANCRASAIAGPRPCVRALVPWRSDHGSRPRRADPAVARLSHSRHSRESREAYPA